MKQKLSQKRKISSKQKQNKRIIHVLVLMSFLFLTLIIYLTYFELFIKDNIISSSYNRRLWEREDKIVRGEIFDRKGVSLAHNEIVGNEQERVYPFGPLYSHVIGYNSTTYGKSLLEAKYNDQLLNINPLNPVTDLRDKLTGSRSFGNNLYLTIDHKLEKRASELMGRRNGAVVALHPQTGEILALVSKPDFNPAESSLEERWHELIESEENPLLPRATQGLYVPGSTFKAAVSLMAVDKGLDNKTYEDTGSIIIDGKKIENHGKKAYGTLDLENALAVSSNTVFARIGVELGEENLNDLARQLGLGKKISFDIPLSTSRFDYKNMGKTDQAAVGIGQGKILVTPLHMALITGGIANNGVVMKPYLVDRVVTANGFILKDREPGEFFRLADPDTAKRVKEMMKGVVDKGTGKNAKISGVSVAGKTGTAQNELTAQGENKEHAWFIGFAPVENPQIAVSVILEYSGSTGGGQAAPIARELMVQWLKEQGLM
ncbi:MAG: peptidoglycan D,D-transpeptidase FtsI family protein [Bacillota bacterium]|jgi:peptidoglycan glycosyltransferase|nr:peptidoglycan glycosyltransferase [Clostridia bacterium]